QGHPRAVLGGPGPTSGRCLTARVVPASSTRVLTNRSPSSSLELSAGDRAGLRRDVRMTAGGDDGADIGEIFASWLSRFGSALERQAVDELIGAFDDDGYW